MITLMVDNFHECKLFSFVCTFIFNSSVADSANFNNSNKRNKIITFSFFLVFVEPGDILTR